MRTMSSRIVIAVGLLLLVCVAPGLAYHVDTCRTIGQNPTGYVGSGGSPNPGQLRWDNAAPYVRGWADFGIGGLSYAPSTADSVKLVFYEMDQTQSPNVPVALIRWAYHADPNNQTNDLWDSLGVGDTLGSVTGTGQHTPAYEQVMNFTWPGSPTPGPDAVLSWSETYNSPPDRWAIGCANTPSGTQPLLIFYHQ
jgi:hypothetical protein